MGSVWHTQCPGVITFGFVMTWKSMELQWKGVMLPVEMIIVIPDYLR